MLIAQAAGEYGGLASLATTFQTLITRASDTIGGWGVKEWGIIAAVGVAVIVFFGRRR